KGGSPHIYVFLFRPALADDVMNLMNSLLSKTETQALRELFATTAAGKNRQQRKAVAGIVDRYLVNLMPLVDGYEFRAISTRRAVNLFLERVETRAPRLSGQGQRFGGTINMHYSWRQEMTPWRDLL